MCLSAKCRNAPDVGAHVLVDVGTLKTPPPVSLTSGGRTGPPRALTQWSTRQHPQILSIKMLATKTSSISVISSNDSFVLRRWRLCEHRPRVRAEAHDSNDRNVNRVRTNVTRPRKGTRRTRDSENPRTMLKRSRNTSLHQQHPRAENQEAPHSDMWKRESVFWEGPCLAVKESLAQECFLCERPTSQD